MSASRTLLRKLLVVRDGISKTFIRDNRKPGDLLVPTDRWTDEGERIYEPRRNPGKGAGAKRAAARLADVDAANRDQRLRLVLQVKEAA